MKYKLLRELMEIAEKEHGPLTEVQRRVQLRKSWNDGTRTLMESILPNEVTQALKDWGRADIKNCALIGGSALNYWGKPRYTEDGDFVFISKSDIPESVPGFKKIRDHAFQHNKTHVTIEVLDPEFLKRTSEFCKKIVDTAVESDGIKIASKEGIIASKLGRFKDTDKGDIEQLMQIGGKLDKSWIDLLTDDEKKNYQISVENYEKSLKEDNFYYKFEKN